MSSIWIWKILIPLLIWRFLISLLIWEILIILFYREKRKQLQSTISSFSSLFRCVSFPFVLHFYFTLSTFLSTPKYITLPGRINTEKISIFFLFLLALFWPFTRDVHADSSLITTSTAQKQSKRKKKPRQLKMEEMDLMDLKNCCKFKILPSSVFVAAFSLWSWRQS